MLWTGLSGGIGSGKSTVSARLAQLGAVVVDADRVAREVVEPGTPALAEIAERFGPEVLRADGTLDRPALGAVVFGDERARRDLEAITHPRIHARSAQLLDAAPDDAVVVHDIPLLVEMGRACHYALTVVVDVPEQVRLRRLVQLRGMDEGEARRRIAAQADDAQRRRAADVLLDNTGSLEQLHAAVDRLWHERLVPFEAGLRQGRPGGGEPTTAAGDGADAGAELLAGRVRHALGEHLVRPDAEAGPGPESGPDLADALQVEVRDLAVLDDPAVRERLTRVGLVAVATEGVQEGWVLASADPAQTARARVRSSSRTGAGR